MSTFILLTRPLLQARYQPSMRSTMPWSGFQRMLRALGPES